MRFTQPHEATRMAATQTCPGGSGDVSVGVTGATPCRTLHHELRATGPAWTGRTRGRGDARRGSLFYDLAKANAIRIAYALSHELHDHRVTALALSPGFLRSEAVLDHFGVTEATWELYAAYGFSDVDGSTPDWGRHPREVLAIEP